MPFTQPDIFVEQNNEAPIEARYDLGEWEMGSLTQLLLAEKPPTVENGLACYEIEASSPYADIARTLERNVFEEAFDGNDENFFREQYGPYDSASTFFLSVDVTEKTPVGVLRVIKNSSAGFKTLNDTLLRDRSMDATEMFKAAYALETADTTWDIGTVGVVKERRSAAMEASLQLYRSLYVAAMRPENGADHFISVIDQNAHNQLTKFLGIPFKPLMGMPPMEYLGSKKSRPVYGDTAEFYGRMDRRRTAVHIGASVLEKIPGRWSHKKARLLGRLASGMDLLMDGETSGKSLDATLQF